MNNPYEYRSPLNRNYGISSSSGNHSYNVYPTENASSPTHHHFSYESSSGTNASTSAFNLTSSTVNRKSHAVDSIKIEDDTDKSARIDYPHSPPPESDSSPSNKKPKYSSSSSAYHSNHATSPSTCSDTTLSQSLNDTDSSDKKNLIVSGSSFRTSSLLTPGRQSLSSDHSEDKTLTSGLQRGRKRGTDKVNTPRRRKVEADST
ncbi:hypothetical protein BDB01DRAFT_797143 [Pilobolus umbonatus]|nr:hypothetical protein BDB01DRAFT_797143 [Pilobolus umbonatus]